MNEVASNSKLSEITMPLGVSDTGGGEATLKGMSTSGSASVDVVDEDEDRSQLLFAIMAFFFANNLIRSRCSREKSPAGDGSKVDTGN